MGSASTDRLVTARKVRKHNGKLLGRIEHEKAKAVQAEQKAEARISKTIDSYRLRADSLIQSAMHEMDHAKARISELVAAQPLLDPFQRTWCGKGFFRRVWNAVRYIFIGEAVWHG